MTTTRKHQERLLHPNYMTYRALGLTAVNQTLQSLAIKRYRGITCEDTPPSSWSKLQEAPALWPAQASLNSRDGTLSVAGSSVEKPNCC